MATSFPVAVSVKLENGVESDELNANVSTNEMKPSAEPQAARQAASYSPQNVLPLALAPSLDESFLIAVPPEKAVLASYPPGCHVLHVNTNDTPPLVTFGVVQSVSIDLTSRLFVYRVAPTYTGTGNTFLSPESQLQWSPSSKVWACLSSNGTGPSVWKPCIVLTAYQPSPQSPPLFSLQIDGSSRTGALFHGIPEQCIKYRSADSGTSEGEESAVGVAPLVVNEGPVPHAPAPGFVRASRASAPQSPPLISLQIEGSSETGALFHSIPEECIKYRPADSGTSKGEESAVGVAPLVVNKGPVRHAPAPEFVPLGRSVVNEKSVSPDSAQTFVQQGPVMNQAPASRASPELFVPEGFVMNEQPASRAPRRLSLVSNYSSQSRSSQTMAIRFTPAATRPSDTEIERPSAKRAKMNEGLPSPMGSAGNNEKVATPVGSVVQFPTSSEEAVNQELSVRRRSKTQVTAAEEEYADNETSGEEDLSTVDFVIPGCVFDVEMIKDFVRENWKSIKRETNCKISLIFRGKGGGSHQMGMCLELTGPREQIKAAEHAVERCLVALVDENERGRALYYTALVNKHRRKSGNIVFQYCYHLDHPGMKHMLHQKLPKDCQEIIGYVIGKKGSRKKNIEYEMKCKIDINVDCGKPHFVIYGDTDTDVRECGRQLNEVVQQGRVRAQRQGRLR